MPARATTRLFVCLLLVFSLCAPIVAIAAPAAHANRAAEFRALAAPAGSHHRPATPSLFTVVPLHTATSDPGHRAATVELRAPRSIWTAQPRTGRSPPAIS
jgi:hypothetical protein